MGVINFDICKLLAVLSKGRNSRRSNCVYSGNYRGEFMKKKILLTILLALLVLIPVALADNPRFDDITADSLNHISIDSHNPGEPENKTINDCQQIKTVLRFLKSLDLITLAVSDSTYPSDRNIWLYHISLNDYFNKIYLFKNRIFIGKSVYGIKPETIEEFRKLYNKLK